KLAFSNTLHREMIINTTMAKKITIRTTNIPPSNVHNMPPSILLICHIASGLILHVVTAPENSKAKFIIA
ncbi:MAG: hypothetical protein WCG98_05745, partial [bacterium]